MYFIERLREYIYPIRFMEGYEKLENHWNGLVSVGDVFFSTFSYARILDLVFTAAVGFGYSGKHFSKMFE